MSLQPPAIELSGVSRRFGRTIALRGVDLQIGPAESVAVLGVNGAGKTTLLRTMCALARPTRGRISVLGLDPWSDRTRALSRVGVVGHQSYLYPELTCAENLRFFATMFGVADADEAVDEALGRVSLSHRRDDRAGALSRGLLQRLNLARATIHSPDLLILDEPDTGLDEPGRGILRQVIDGQVARGGSVVFTTHAIERGLSMATRCVLLERGSLRLDRPVSDGLFAEIAPLLSLSEPDQ